MILSAEQLLEARGLDAEAVRRLARDAGVDPDDPHGLVGELARRGWDVDRMESTPAGVTVELERRSNRDHVIVAHAGVRERPHERGETQALRNALAVLLVDAVPDGSPNDGA